MATTEQKLDQFDVTDGKIYGSNLKSGYEAGIMKSRKMVAFGPIPELVKNAGNRMESGQDASTKTKIEMPFQGIGSGIGGMNMMNICEDIVASPRAAFSAAAAQLPDGILKNLNKL